MPDLLAIDIGNTNATCAHMRGLKVVLSFEVPSASTVEEILAAFRLQQLKGLSLAAIASVNPRACENMEAALKRHGFTKVAVSLGHCTEPQNVAAGGHGCMVDHACESCPFFLVDPLERDGMEAKRHALRVKLERARVINAQQHLLDHYEARIKDPSTIIDGIDAYIDGLPDDERLDIREAVERMADIRRRATAARKIDLRQLLEANDDT
jgi:hypothetical protein